MVGTATSFHTPAVRVVRPKGGSCNLRSHRQVGSALPADPGAPCALQATYNGRTGPSLGRLAELRLADAEDAVEEQADGDDPEQPLPPGVGRQLLERTGRALRLVRVELH